MPTEILMNALPFPIVPSDDGWRSSGDFLQVSAKPVSDLFVYPGTTGDNPSDIFLNATRVLGFAPEGDFQFTARVEADLTNQLMPGFSSCGATRITGPSSVTNYPLMMTAWWYRLSIGTFAMIPMHLSSMARMYGCGSPE